MKKGRLDTCLSDDAIFSMVEGETSAERMSAFSHLEDCSACQERYQAAEALENRFRSEGQKARLMVDAHDVQHLIDGVLRQAKGITAYEEFAERGKKHLEIVLSPVFGERLTKRSIHLASQEDCELNRLYSAEAKWNEFALKLGNIFSTVCGAAGKNAVLHLSQQVLAGAV